MTHFSSREADLLLSLSLLGRKHFSPWVPKLNKIKNRLLFSWNLSFFICHKHDSCVWLEEKVVGGCVDGEQIMGDLADMFGPKLVDTVEAGGFRMQMMAGRKKRKLSLGYWIFEISNRNLDMLKECLGPLNSREVSGVWRVDPKRQLV